MNNLCILLHSLFFCSVLGPALTFRVGHNPKNVSTADLVQVAGEAHVYSLITHDDPVDCLHCNSSHFYQPGHSVAACASVNENKD